MKVPPLPPAETPSLTCVRVVIITSDEKRIVDDVSSPSRLYRIRV